MSLTDRVRRLDDRVLGPGDQRVRLINLGLALLALALVAATLNLIFGSGSAGTVVIPLVGVVNAVYVRERIGRRKR